MGLFQLSTENSFERAFQQLWHASSQSKKLFQQTVFDAASALLKEPNGLEKLYVYAHLFDRNLDCL